MSWKGLLLAGGTGSRLFPLTAGTNKHVLPVFDKPMIYYPLTTLMLAGIRDIVVVASPQGVEQLRALLGDGRQFGVALEYIVQPHPRGVADGLILAEKPLAGHEIAMILGDNIFIGAGLETNILAAKSENRGATIFGYEVANPSAFGVVVVNDGKLVDIIEKPDRPISRVAVTGLYLYNKDACAMARELIPSARDELEITDLNKAYLRAGTLNLRGLGRGTAWIDGGTPDDLHEAAQFVHVVQKRAGLKIAAPEEIAYRRGFISRVQLVRQIDKLPASEYRDYLRRIIETTSDETAAKSGAALPFPNH